MNTADQPHQPQEENNGTGLISGVAVLSFAGGLIYSLRAARRDQAKMQQEVQAATEAALAEQTRPVSTTTTTATNTTTTSANASIQSSTEAKVNQGTVTNSTPQRRLVRRKPAIEPKSFWERALAGRRAHLQPTIPTAADLPVVLNSTGSTHSSSKRPATISPEELVKRTQRGQSLAVRAFGIATAMTLLSGGLLFAGAMWLTGSESPADLAKKVQRTAREKLGWSREMIEAQGAGSEAVAKEEKDLEGYWERALDEERRITEERNRVKEERKAKRDARWAAAWNRLIGRSSPSDEANTSIETKTQS
ncbi:hypothetical protein GQ42DRAFT_157347 [Ramicandelaber brevisporus]|nr:hypothetical protein GQ42DRAFT_157347 [Ramicandelaber brevisporus]